MSELEEYSRQAHAITNEAREIFLGAFGAGAAVDKHDCDFATQADLDIERLYREKLSSITGLPVLGEEFGGDPRDHDRFWIVDPIDGTANYSCRNPQAAILLSLINDGEPVVSITDIPFLDVRLSTIGTETRINGDIARHHQGHGLIGYGRMNVPGRYELLGRVMERFRRIRISGSVGIDHAYTAQGIYDGCISFSPNLWDNAAGVAHMRGLGVTVTDLEGRPWSMLSTGICAGIEPVHNILLEVINQ
ncbi:MAG: inositol monophosphatase [Corynebacterium sp.]|nr:inositol monophosphatase [Corynebacterium sp.]